MNFGLEGKAIVVTGSATGIGCSIVRTLIEEGAVPICFDKEEYDESELKKVLENEEIPREKIQYHKCDISDKIEIESAVTKMPEVRGLVNNAALLGEDPEEGRTLQNWDKLIQINARAGYHMIELLYRKMKEGSSIVNIGSIDLRMCAPNVVLYNAAKGALLGMTVAYAVTLAKHCIRVNMVSPGHVMTIGNKKLFDDPKGRRLIEGFENRTPMRRSVMPEEVSNVVVFLLSGKSSGITGEEVIVDCGYTRALYDREWAPDKFK